MKSACVGASGLLRMISLHHGAGKWPGLCECFGLLCSLGIWIHFDAAASAHACRRVRISPSAEDLIAAWCGHVSWSVQLLGVDLIARHVDPLGWCVSSCMQACVCVCGSVHELVASARQDAALHWIANGGRPITTNRPKSRTRIDQRACAMGFIMS